VRTSPSPPPDSFEEAIAVSALLATAGNMLLFFSPLRTMLTIVSKRGVGAFSPAPYVTGLVSCSLWAVYCWTMGGRLPPAVSNLVGAVLQACYIAIFVFYSPSGRRLPLLYGVVALVASVAALILIWTLVVGGGFLIFHVQITGNPTTGNSTTSWSPTSAPSAADEYGTGTKVAAWSFAAEVEDGLWSSSSLSSSSSSSSSSWLGAGGQTSGAGTTRSLADARALAFAQAMGVSCLLFTLLSYAAPLAVIRVVLATRSVEYMPLSLSLAVFVSGFSWAAYGFLKQDPLIALPNLAGGLLGTIQLAVYLGVVSQARLFGTPQKRREHLKSLQLSPPKGAFGHSAVRSSSSSSSSSDSGSYSNGIAMSAIGPTLSPNGRSASPISTDSSNSCFSQEDHTSTADQRRRGSAPGYLGLRRDGSASWPSLPDMLDTVVPERSRLARLPRAEFGGGGEAHAAIADREVYDAHAGSPHHSLLPPTPPLPQRHLSTAGAWPSHHQSRQGEALRVSYGAMELPTAPALRSEDRRVTPFLRGSSPRDYPTGPALAEGSPHPRIARIASLTDFTQALHVLSFTEQDRDERTPLPSSPANQNDYEEWEW